VFRPRLNLSLNELSPESVVLAVVHAPVRGSRKAIQDAIYEAGASNLASIHQDFEELSMAYDLCAIDRPLTESQLKRIQEIAKELTGEAGAVRSIRQIPLQFST
jgi:D-3-phosphoglycerate dehydrogenase